MAFAGLSTQEMVEQLATNIGKEEVDMYYDQMFPESKPDSPESAEAKALFSKLLDIPPEDIPFDSAFSGKSLLDHWTQLLESEGAEVILRPWPQP